MKACASTVSIALATVSCGVGPPAYDFGEETTATDPVDGAADVEVGAGPRVLSDVGAPRKIDARTSAGSGGSAGVDAGESSPLAGVDASARGGSDASDTGANETGRDAAPEGRGGTIDGRDAAADVVRAPLSEGGRDASPPPLVDASSVEERVDEPSGREEDTREKDTSPEVTLVPEGASDSSVDGCDACSIGAHLLITEVATRPSGAEMIEVFNPTSRPIALFDYLLSDSHLYYKVATGSFTTASGSDFAARFPEGAAIEPGQYVVVALANASGGSISFETAYGQKPDFELRPTANGASDDPIVPNMQPAQPGSSIGATSSLTDAGEPIILFFYREGARVFDVDYLFFGTPSASNPVVDKTGVEIGGGTYAADTPAASQHPAPPPDVGSLHRCRRDEPDEKQIGGNGLAGHDETSENAAASFVAAQGAEHRTPGGPPPPGLCNP